jgi:hypothetical protein
MRPTRKPLATLALGLALATATTTAGATPPSGTQDQTDQRRALYQSELEHNLQQRTRAGREAVAQRMLAPQRRALYRSELERALERRRALGAVAAQPAARTGPAAPGPGVDVAVTLLVGLTGGLLGGAAAVVGWTATSRRRWPRTAVST